MLQHGNSRSTVFRSNDSAQDASPATNLVPAFGASNSQPWQQELPCEYTGLIVEDPQAGGFFNKEFSVGVLLIRRWILRLRLVPGWPMRVFSTLVSITSLRLG